MKMMKEKKKTGEKRRWMKNKYCISMCAEELTAGHDRCIETPCTPIKLLSCLVKELVI